MSEKKNFSKFLLKKGIELGILSFFNSFILTKSTEKNILKPGFGKYYKWKYGDIYYKETGKGKPILLIHDLSGSSSAYEWNRVVKKLRETNKVYTLDLLGCGRSDKPDISYANYLYVELISDFIREIIGEKTDIAATGLSSSFVMMCSAIHPEQINRITMINPLPLNTMKKQPDNCSKIIRAISAVPIIGTTAFLLFDAKHNIEYQMTEKNFYNPLMVHQKDIDAYYEAAHLDKGRGKFLQACINGNYLYADISRILSSTSKPVEILYGEKNHAGYAAAREYRKLQPSVRLKGIQNTKYLPQLEKPEEFLKAFCSEDRQ